MANERLEVNGRLAFSLVNGSLVLKITVFRLKLRTYRFQRQNNENLKSTFVKSSELFLSIELQVWEQNR